MSPSVSIKELKAGDRIVEGVYLLAEMEIRTTRTGRPYLSARLRDASGQIEARFWDLPPGLADQLREGRGVQISGEVVTYKEQLQLKLDAIAPEAVDPTGFMPSSPRPTDEMVAELQSYSESIHDPWLRQLLEETLLHDSAFHARFIRAPAAKVYHHACLGGLLEHSLGVAGLAQVVCQRYPQIPRDLLVTLALLHDVGKVDTYDWEVVLDFSDQGRLVDHLYLGAHRVERAIETISGFPEELRWRILHALLAHHGDKEAGSPVLPQTLEAVVLHQLDMLDARIRGFQDHLERQSDPDAAWTDKSSMFRTRLYRGNLSKPTSGTAAEGEDWEWFDTDEEELPF